MTKTLISAGRVVTCDTARDPDDPLGVIADGAVVTEGGIVVAVGDREALEPKHPDALRQSHEGALLTPGLVDAHTHAAWVGSRGREYALRMAGAGYEEIAAAGGGIVASMQAVRQAGAAELQVALLGRLRRMAALGVTTVEVKSGYGLNEAAERRQLEAVALAAEQPDLPRVVPTFLGLHALPPDGGDHQSYAAACRRWLDGIAADGLARFVDAYIDRAAFSAAEARPVLARARELGLDIRLHCGQFADVGGVELGVELQAASIDHLEHVSEGAAELMAEAGTSAGLLPVASFTLAQPPPPVALLRRTGVSLVVASDANPGSAPTESLPLALSFAARSYGLTVREIILGATAVAARSLKLPAGVLKVGAPADLVVWDLAAEQELLQPWGVPKTKLVLRDGRPIHHHA